MIDVQEEMEVKIRQKFIIGIFEIKKQPLQDDYIPCRFIISQILKKKEMEKERKEERKPA